MDANKRDKLFDIDYSVKRCCSFCVHSSLTPMSGKPFGKCSLLTYDHIKHGNERELSVSAFGSCVFFKECESKTNVLNGFREFFK